MPTQLQPGALVHVRGEEWRLARVEAFDRCSVLTLEPRGGGRQGERLRVIEPFDRPVPVRDRPLRRHPRPSVLESALAAIAASRPARGLWTAAAASIDLHSYQLEPALAVLQGATRVLLADAVGLGKTIQAGLVLAELRERGWVERALVVCPAGLRASWAAELGTRFGIEAAVFDQRGIAEAIAGMPVGINPWSTATTAIASVDFIKRPEVLAAVSEVPFDLLIVDEAHHLTPGTDRGLAIGRLAARTPWCVFASATPHSGDEQAFDYLTSLGHHDEPIVIFRRTRADASVAGCRSTHLLAIRPTPSEAALLDGVERYVRAIWQARGRGDGAVQLLAIALSRRAASSAVAIERTLVRRLALVGHPVGPIQPRLPWDDDDEADGDGADAVLAARGFDDEDSEREAIERLIALARACHHESKLRRLVRLLALAREPAIVFTEYRDTVDAVMAALPGALRAVTISGAMSAADRRRAIEAFNGGGADILVATDAAGEGLNLQHRCRLVIDIELPWNPLRLEQRIGRVDRLGQGRRVHAISLYHPGGIEERVLRHLRLRQRRAGADAVPALEIDVARALFDGAVAERTPFPGMHTVKIDGAAEEAARLGHMRGLRARVRRLDHPAGVGPRPGRPSRVVVVREVTETNGNGSIVAERSEAWQIDLAPFPRREWRDVISSIATRLPPPQPGGAAGAHAAVARRVAAIRSQVAAARRRAIQHSLFDGRAEAAAAHEREIAARTDVALQRCLDATATHPRGAARPTLVAMWPLPTP